MKQTSICNGRSAIRRIRSALLSLAILSTPLLPNFLNQAFGQDSFNSNGYTGQDSFSSGSGPTGTQGVVGNPDCPPPTIIENGVPVTPLNWSCDSSRYWSRPPVVVNNPCEPNYDMSTPQGIAAAQQQAPQNAIACNEQRCAHNPDLEICQQIAVQTPVKPEEDEPQYQLVPGVTPGPCDNNGTNFTDAQLQTLQQALAGARNMLALTKAAVHPATWSKQTSQIGEKWFGNTSLATRNLIRARVEKSLAKANAISRTNFYLLPAPSQRRDACAFVYHNDDTAIYITPLYWGMTPGFQAEAVVHEISHFDSVNGADGGTKDYSYNTDWCLGMASASQSFGGKATAALIGQGDPAKRMQCNATSFQKFVAEVAAQPQ